MNSNISGEMFPKPLNQIGIHETPADEPPSKTPPRPENLPPIASPSQSIATITVNEADKCPDGSVTKNLLEIIGRGTVGIDATTLKDNFNQALEKDKKLPTALRILKGGARVSGLVLGMVINLTAKILAFSVAVAASPVVMVGVLIAVPFQEKSTLWHDPRGAVSFIFSMGIGIGASAGAVMGVLGNVLINSSLSINLDSDISQAIEDNAYIASIGASIGTCASLVNPLLWRAAWNPYSMM